MEKKQRNNLHIPFKNCCNYTASNDSLRSTNQLVYLLLFHRVSVMLYVQVTIIVTYHT